MPKYPAVLQHNTLLLFSHARKNIILLTAIQPNTTSSSCLLQLSRHALKDYNRGRSYLTDQAKKDGIPVFSDIQEAVDCAVAKAQAR